MLVDKIKYHHINRTVVILATLVTKILLILLLKLKYNFYVIVSRIVNQEICLL